MTSQQYMTLQALARLGYAVVVFSPSELKGVDPVTLENHLSDIGWCYIEDRLEDPQDLSDNY